MKMLTNRHQEAKLLPPDTFLSRKNAQKCVCGRGSTPDTAGGAYSAPPERLAGNGGGAPREGEGKGEEGEGMDGKGRGRAIPRTKTLATALPRAFYEI